MVIRNFSMAVSRVSVTHGRSGKFRFHRKWSRTASETGAVFDQIDPEAAATGDEGPNLPSWSRA